MKTDSLFYRLFQRWPKLAQELLGLDYGGEGYRFGSEEIKQTAFRIDGLFTPPEGQPDLPLIFIEVQYQPDDGFYGRLFSETCLYLRHNTPQHPWLALVIYPNRTVEKTASRAFLPFMALPQLHRVYLEDYCDQTGGTLAMDMIRLIASGEQQTISLARELAAQRDIVGPDGLDFIETILVYKLPQFSREEIRAMLALDKIELKQTRFYQEIAAEERQEGKLEGKLEGRAQTLQQLLTKRFGPLPQWAVEHLQQARLEQLELWCDRVLDAPTLAKIFE